jgi:hypothetical protein
MLDEVSERASPAIGQEYRDLSEGDRQSGVGPSRRPISDTRHEDMHDGGRVHQEDQ